MINDSSSSPSQQFDVEHRGWHLQATWFRASLGVAEGWVCFATRPAASHRLNLGRWSNSELALENGRAYVDRRIDEPVTSRVNLPIQKRRK